MKTYCLALDLKDDPALIEEYRRYHQPNVIWPEVIESIRAAGILNEQIFLLGTRMVMVLQTDEDFSFEQKAALDKANPRMQAWEHLMWRFQQPVPQARSGEKWVLMEKIFEA
jgi:L-rhamnose mutarotase